MKISETFVLCLLPCLLFAGFIYGIMRSLIE